MYEIKYNDNYIYIPGDKDYVTINPTLELKANKAGALIFSILDTHPLYNELEKLKVSVRVLKDGDTIFKGRIVGSERNFDNELEMTVEGKLAVLNDSPCRPFEFTGTPEELFTWFIDNHNSQVGEEQKLLKGNVTVTDPNNYINRSWDKTDNTWNLINSRLIDTLGGYLVIRYEDDGDYLDWLEGFSYYSTQSIEFGKNLTDFEQLINAEETYTACIPYGAEIINSEYGVVDTESATWEANKYYTLSGERYILIQSESTFNAAVSSGTTIYEITSREGTGQLLTIKSVNDGKDYLINEERAAIFGTIYAPADLTTWEDVGRPENLLQKAKDWLNNTGVMLKETIELSAVDLAMTGADINAFEMYKNVSIKSEPHGIDTSRLITSLTIAVDLSEVTKVILGSSRLILSAQISANNKQTSTIVQRVEKIEADYVTNEQLEDIGGGGDGADGIGIESYTRYYLLQSSELTAPAKPTTYPPSSEWISTEPAFDEENIGNLYTVDCTVFSDGTWSYTDVSLSTSYEAAKAAYNKAQAASNEIIEVSSQILQTAEEITLGILAGYTTASDLENYKKQVENLLKVNEEGVSMEFEQMAAKLNELGGEITTQKQYIRFIEGSIYIGHSDSPYSSVYTNDTLEFRYNNQMVARFTNEVLEVRNISAENQVAWFHQWAIRKGAYIDDVGYNLNDMWIGG